MAKKSGGSGVKPSHGASGVYGMMAPVATQAHTPQARPAPGRLCHGRPAVRMTKSTRVCVASDSTNQPVEQALVGVEDAEHDGEGEEVVDRGERPDHQHVAPDEGDVPALGLQRVGGVHAVRRDRHLGEVVEEVVEQDLQRQHGQEGQEERRRGHAQHVAEVGAGAHQHVLHDVAEAPPPSDHPVVEHVQPLLEQDDVGRVAGHVHRGVHRDADVGACGARARR